MNLFLCRIGGALLVSAALPSHANEPSTRISDLPGIDVKPGLRDEKKPKAKAVGNQ